MLETAIQERENGTTFPPHSVGKARPHREDAVGMGQIPGFLNGNNGSKRLHNEGKCTHYFRFYGNYFIFVPKST